MRYLYTVLFVLAFAAYVAALFNIGNNTGEPLSDTGNALMLSNCALMLLVSRWQGTQTAGHTST